MKQEQMATALYESTIKVVASDGLDKTTTKSIAKGAGLNEVYIYRLFEDKEDLLFKTFELLDDELATACLARLPVMEREDIPFKDKCRVLFDGVWQFILNEPDRCKYFIRYFYSPYFRRFSADNHRVRFDAVVSIMAPAFEEPTNTWMMLNHIINILFDFTVKVFDGEMPNDEKTADLVFTLVYSSVIPYLSKNITP